jgi:hypothetical protein
MTKKTFIFFLAVFLSCLVSAQSQWTPASDFEVTLVNGSITITRYNGSASVVNIPAEMEGLPVTAIGVEAFATCSGLISITIPNSVTFIMDGAFDNCSSLTSITVNSENSSYSSQNGVLFGRDGMTLWCYPAGKPGDYTIPGSVDSIASYAFRDCTGLTSITIPNSVTSIGGGAFFGCSGLTSLAIPKSVVIIGGDAFSGCSGLSAADREAIRSRFGDGLF